MKISELFSKVSDEERDQNQDYKVTYSKKSIVIMFIASVLFAFAVWTVAVVAESSVRSFDSINIQIVNENADYSYELSSKTVSFVCRGRTSVINSFNDSSIVPYIDVSGYAPGTYTMEIKYYYDSRNTLRLSDFSISTVKLTIAETESSGTQG